MLRKGFIVGNGSHMKNGTSRHGVFCMSRGPFLERLRLARDRSTSRRDTEWEHGPNGWSTPCVIAFLAEVEDVTVLTSVGGCKKSVIEAPPQSIRPLPWNAMLCFHCQEYELYRDLPNKEGELMLCGGKEEKGVVDKLYWSLSLNNMPASCGRCCLVGALRNSNNSWVKTKLRIWFCSNECCQYRNAFWA